MRALDVVHNQHGVAGSRGALFTSGIPSRNQQHLLALPHPHAAGRLQSQAYCLYGGMGGFVGDNVIVAVHASCRPCGGVCNGL